MAKQNTFLIWSLLLLFMGLLMLGWGYTFGHENSIQLVPMALYHADNALYPHDFFIHSADDRPIHERTFFLLLMKPFGDALVWPSFIMFVICSLILFRAIIGIGTELTGSLSLAFSALILVAFPFNFHSLGMNELISRELSAALVSDMASLCAIWMFIRKKVRSTYLLLILSTGMHPLSGFQVALLITGALFTDALVKKQLKPYCKKYGPVIAGYFIVAILFISYLRAAMGNSTWNDAEFFHSFFVFRNAHHYIPTQFPKTDWLLLTPLFLLTPFLLFKQNKQLFYISLFIIGGCVLYSIGVLHYHSVTVASAQWFKTTAILEVFSLILVLNLLKSWITAYGKNMARYILPVYLISSVASFLFKFPGYDHWRNSTDYEFPFYTRETPEIEISRQLAEKTDKDALILQPAGLDEVKYYSKRSSYIDYKALTHTRAFIEEWSARFREVYAIDPATSKVISFAARDAADSNFKDITPEKLRDLQETRGITHIITFADVQLPFESAGSNERYIIYKLN